MSICKQQCLPREFIIEYFYMLHFYTKSLTNCKVKLKFYQQDGTYLDIHVKFMFLIRNIHLQIMLNFWAHARFNKYHFYRQVIIVHDCWLKCVQAVGYGIHHIWNKLQVLYWLLSLQYFYSFSFVWKIPDEKIRNAEFRCYFLVLFVISKF